MALVKAIVGALRPAQTITWYRNSDTPEDLTGATITGKIRDVDSGEVRDIAGVLSVTDGSNGAFTWQYAAEDVAASGYYEVQFAAAFSSGSTPAKTLKTPWQVESSL